MNCLRVILDHKLSILISMYRAPNNNYQYLIDLCSTISSIITSNSNDIVWLAGDLNLPNIDWNCNCVSSNNYPTQLCETLINTMLDHNLSQLVDFPTRNNILHVFATNQPSLVTECITIPGISNHEAIIVLSYVTARTQSSATTKDIFMTKGKFSIKKNSTFSANPLPCYIRLTLQ